MNGKGGKLWQFSLISGSSNELQVQERYLFRKREDQTIGTKFVKAGFSMTVRAIYEFPCVNGTAAAACLHTIE